MRKERRVWENGLETAWIGQLRPHVGPRWRSCLAAVDNRPGLGSETAAALEEEEEEGQDVKRM